MKRKTESHLFPELDAVDGEEATSTFVDNMQLPVHRWFRFSAGFSAEWARRLVREAGATTVLDPFAGSATSLLAAQSLGVASWGVEAHPFVFKIASAKLLCRSDPNSYSRRIDAIVEAARQCHGSVQGYPPLIRKCFTDKQLSILDRLRRSFESVADGSPASDLAWLTLVAILRSVSHVGTAPWQYVLPNKSKRSPKEAMAAFESMSRLVEQDMRVVAAANTARATLLLSDARTCDGVPNNSIDLVVTSPPYPNNYDYADATRLEMSFMGEISGWGELHDAVRRHLVTSCSQHWTERTLDVDEVLGRTELAPIREDIRSVCERLAIVRLDHGGRKNYHLMIAAYFADLANVWHALRRVCRSPSQVCFVIGDSAPYGVYVPVVDWLDRLAEAAGFSKCRFEKTRDRNIKWKNRKHRVPLLEGRLWVQG